LQLLSGVAVKAVGVGRRDITPEALRHLLPLGLGQSSPGRADRQAGHRRNVESPANDRLQLLETPALPSALALTSCVSPEELRREDEATCALSSAKVRFAQDSPLEGDGFELPVPVR